METTLQFVILLLLIKKNPYEHLIDCDIAEFLIENENMQKFKTQETENIQALRNELKEIKNDNTMLHSDIKKSSGEIKNEKRMDMLETEKKYLKYKVLQKQTVNLRDKLSSIKRVSKGLLTYSESLTKFIKSKKYHNSFSNGN